MDKFAFSSLWCDRPDASGAVKAYLVNGEE